MSKIKYELIKNNNDDENIRLGKLITNHGTFETPMSGGMHERGSVC